MNICSSKTKKACFCSVEFILCHDFVIIDKHLKQCSLSMTEPVILACGVRLGHFWKCTSIVGSTWWGGGLWERVYVYNPWIDKDTIDIYCFRNLCSREGFWGWVNLQPKSVSCFIYLAPCIFCSREYHIEGANCFLYHYSFPWFNLIFQLLSGIVYFLLRCFGYASDYERTMFQNWQ